MKALIALAAAMVLAAPGVAAAQPDDGTELVPLAAVTAEPFGAACANLPTDPENPASLEAMAKVPVATAAAANPDLSTLVKAVTVANLGDSLNSAEAVTVFAPTNEAFEKVNPEDLASIMSDNTTLTKLLTYHVVPEQLAPEQLAGTHQTLAGTELTVSGGDQDFKVNDTAVVVCGNIPTANGTVYLIDTVLQPAS